MAKKKKSPKKPAASLVTPVVLSSPSSLENRSAAGRLGGPLAAVKLCQASEVGLGQETKASIWLLPSLLLQLGIFPSEAVAVGIGAEEEGLTQASPSTPPAESSSLHPRPLWPLLEASAGATALQAPAPALQSAAWSPVQAAPATLPPTAASSAGQPPILPSAATRPATASHPLRESARSPEESAAAGTDQQQVGEYVHIAHVLPRHALAPGTCALSPSLADCLGRPLPGSAIILFKVKIADGSTDTAAASTTTTATEASHASLRLVVHGVDQTPMVLPVPVPGPSPDLLPGQAPPLAGTSPRPRKQWPAQAHSPAMGKAARDWLMRMLGVMGHGASSEAASHGALKQGLLSLLARGHLHGRALLPGNPVTLPIMGRACIFRVLSINNSTSNPHMLTMGHHTVIELQGPDGHLDNHTHDSGSTGSQKAAQAGLVMRAVEAATAAVSTEATKAAADAVKRALASGNIALAAGTDLNSLGGMHAQKRALQELVILPLQAPHLFARFGLQPPCGVLLWGAPGTGKSQLARAAARTAGAQLLVLNGPDMLSAVYGDTEAAIQGVFAAARALAPAVIFIDEADALATARATDDTSHHAASAAGEASARTVATLLGEMDSLRAGGDGEASQVVVVAATNRPQALDAALRRPGRFDREVEVGVPSPADRAAILRNMLQNMQHSLRPHDIDTLASQLHGYVGADLAAVCTRAGFLALQRHVAARQASSRDLAVQSAPLLASMADMQSAEAQVGPSALREVALEVPRVRWEDVGGLENVKQRLKEAVQWPQLHAESLARLGAQAPRGVLLMGPPGCSKTLLARAVAAESGLAFLAVKGPELLSKWVGASEQAVAQLFSRARGAAPAIVFFDELDGLVGSRDSDGISSGVGSRVLAQLLSEMDGLKHRTGVVVLAATNRPDRLDPALLRPGRFDRLVYVPVPDCVGREAILRVQTRGVPLATDVELPALAQHTAWYTGADLSALVRQAGLTALEEDLSCAEIAARHFAQALQVVGPSPSPSSHLVALYKQYERQ